MILRQYLRARRKEKRLRADAARDALLETEAGRRDFRNGIAAECAESSLIALLEQALDQPGDIAECGVYRGASLRRIALTVKDRAPDRTVFGLDSFEGFPEAAIAGADTGLFRSRARLLGKFRDAGDVPGRLDRFAQVFDLPLDLRRGYFEATLPGIAGRTFCFLHIDCDTYAGHVEVLGALWDRIVPGGIVVFDDYKAEAWPGATQAVDEFLAGRPETVALSELRTRPAWYTVKAS